MLEKPALGWIGHLIAVRCLCWIDHPMPAPLNRRDLLAGLSTVGAAWLGGHLNSTANAWGQPASNTRSRHFVDTTYQYELDLQSEGFVLLGPDEEPKKVAFNVNAQQSFSERAIITDGNRMASRLYRSAKLEKRFGAMSPETVSIEPAPLRVITLPEHVDSGRMLFYSAERPLSAQIISLLQTPLSPIWLDELAVILFQDKSKLATGDRVPLNADLLTKLFCLEAVTEQSVVCEVEKANDSQAVLKLTGDVSGRSLDVTTKIRFNASARAIFETRSLSQLRASIFEQREKGVISPSYAVTTKLKLDQTPATEEISAETIRQQIGLTGSDLILNYTSNTNQIEFQHSPQWHLVLDQKGAAIWRLIVDGEPMTQCNMLLPVTPSREKIDLSTFAKEVEQTLQESQGRIVNQQTLRGANQAEVFRVTAIGKEEEIDLTWAYYFIQDNSGRRAQLVFTTEADLQDAVGQSDLLIAQSFILKSAPIAQTPATVR